MCYFDKSVFTGIVNRQEANLDFSCKMNFMQVAAYE